MADCKTPLPRLNRNHSYFLWLVVSRLMWKLSVLFRSTAHKFSLNRYSPPLVVTFHHAGLLSSPAFYFPGCDSALRARSPDEPSPRHIERVIDQSLHPFDETYRMRQARVMVECSFVYPA